jgi:hypothetical protein
MTDNELDRLQALVDAATKGPWEYHDRGTNYDWDVTGPRCLDLSGYVKGMFWNRENAAFIAASRDAMPALIAEVRRLRAALTEIGSIWTLPVSARDAADYAVDVARRSLVVTHD